MVRAGKNLTRPEVEHRRPLHQQRNFADDARFGRALRKLVSNPRTSWDIATIIINDCLDKLPDSAIQKIYDNMSTGGTKLASRQATQLFVVGYITKKILADALLSVAISRITRMSVGAIAGGLVIQGMIARASEASRRLLNDNPRLYWKLRHQDFDMLYFLFEGMLKPYIQLSRMHHAGDGRFEQVLNEIERMG
ncbi:hypothetical protein CLM71_09815 [Serratia sp. MYb239]|nr:hypothetical protein CLM71_09815 [Serratia sp. MYb239]